MAVNKVLLLGNLGNDPELKYTNTQTPVCNLSMATTERWNDKSSGQPQEKTEWHRVIVWGKQAENCNQYLKKGSKVFVEGKITTRSWDDEKTGQKRYSTEIIANNVQFVNSKIQENDALKDAHDKNETDDYNVSTDTNFASDDIPF